MNKGSYQDELDNYFKSLLHLEVAERIIYKGSLTKARKKLKYEAFIALNDHMINYYYDNFQTTSWIGLNLLAVDGTTIRVPDEKEIINHFGVWKTKNESKPCPKARASQMFDVLNKVTIDAIIKPKSEGERELAAFHFLKLTSKDLILLDRGYPAFWLFKLIQSMNAYFCARVSCTKWNVIRQFYESGKTEAIVKLKTTALSSIKCHEMGLDKNAIKVRLIRIELETGETEILITNLTDKNKYSYDLFAELYHLRWPVEEDYKALKYRLDVENFSGKSLHSVYQDFHAKIFSKNLTAVIASTTKKEIDEKNKNCKFPHQINFTQALSKMKHTMVLLFNRPIQELKFIVIKIQKIFIQTTESVRFGRHFPRNHKVKQKRFHYAYKPIT
jgi:hypothetical protein